MPSPVPTPVAAALGLVPTVLDGVRALPGKAVQLPVYAVSHALTSIGTARQGYDNLAERGERLIARLRGTSLDELEDAFEDKLQGTPLARPYDRVEDALEDATESVTRLVRKSSSTARSAAGTATRTVGDGLDKAADTVEKTADKAGSTAKKAPKKAGTATAKTAAVAEKAATATAKAADKAAGTTVKAKGKAADKAEEKVDAAVAEVEEKVDEAAAKVAAAAAKVEQATARAAQAEAEAPKGEPTPAATQPDSTRVETAAAPDVVEAVEKVSAQVGGEVLAHDDLPLPDYDHLTLGSLRGRMRSLDLPQLIQIRDYEKAKANRLPVVTMLDNRIAKLASDPTAPLSGGGGSAPVTPAPSGGSKVDPSTAAETASSPAVAHGGLGDQPR